MNKMMITVMMAMIMSMMMMMMCNILSKKSMNNREKMSPFECGFDPLSSARTPFSIQFFLIAILFLIFDIEIAIMLPVIMNMKMTTHMLVVTMTMFMMVLITGLYYEWKNGVLEWAK